VRVVRAVQEFAASVARKAPPLDRAGIDRGGRLAVFERGRCEAPVIGKVIAVGLVDEITDRQYVIVDGTDGRVHYAELGRLKPGEAPGRGMIVSLVSDRLEGKPRSTPRLTVLSHAELERLPTYDGPTWLDRAIVSREQASAGTIGSPAATGQAPPRSRDRASGSSRSGRGGGRAGSTPPR
jgi:hypothetical protein